MRIKKKYVVLESRLIDISGEFTQFEKKILNKLFKKYGLEKDFNMYKVAAELIEDFELDYVDAYSLARTYSWNKRELFSEFQGLKKNYPLNNLFFDNLGKFVDNFIFKNNLNNNNLSTKISFNGENLGEYENRDVNVNSAYRGLYFYIPFPSFSIVKDGYSRHLNSDEYGARSMSFEIKLSPKSVDGSVVNTSFIDVDDKTIDNNNFHVIVNYKTNLSFEDDSWGYFMSFDVPYPQKLNKEVVNNILNLIMNDVLEKISKTKFDLPEGINPINVNSPLD